MRANVERNQVLHEHAVILSIEVKPVPRVPVAHRLVVDGLGHSDDGIVHVTARLGYMDEPNVPEVLRLLQTAEIECPVKVEQAAYFLSTIELCCGDAPTMARWRKRLFLATSRITADDAEHFCLPRDQRVIMGSHIDL